jgi:hypothetical protein
MSLHHEDGGTVYSSIRNDGRMLHWCDKCKTAWVSKETPVDIEEKRAAPEMKAQLDQLMLFSADVGKRVAEGDRSKNQSP